MDFAAEPVMDVTPPQRGAARPSAPQADDGKSFDDHLDHVNDTPEREAPRAAQTDEPKANTGVETKLEAPPQDEASNADNAAQAVPATAPPVAPPVAAPVIVQIAASAPAPQQQQQSQQNAPIDAAASGAPSSTPTQPTDSAATPGAAAATPAQAKNAAATEQGAAPNTTAGAAQQANATAAAGATTPQQPAPPSPIDAQQLPPEVRAALAATIAPAPEALQPITPRAAKANANADAARQGPEAANAKDAAPATPNAGPNAQANRAAAAPSATRDVAAAAPAPATTSDTSQSAQTPATAATTTQASTHTQHAAADTGAQRAAPAAAQVAREIIRRFDGGNTNFELRLDPPELGRVEVRMEVSRDHRVTAVISADSPQALTELARHARELEQQLQAAGLQLSDNGLSFDLRQGAQGGEKQEASSARGAGDAAATPEQTQAQTARPIGFERWRGVRVDMMV